MEEAPHQQRRAFTLTAALPLSPLQANIKETEVTIPPKLHNSLIGSKGCLVRSIMDDCGGVHIHFPSEGSGSDKVTIRGPAGEVEKAKKQLLQLAEEKVSRGGEDVCWLLGGSNKQHENV